MIQKCWMNNEKNDKEDDWHGHSDNFMILKVQPKHLEHHSAHLFKCSQHRMYMCRTLVHDHFESSTLPMMRCSAEHSSLGLLRDLPWCLYHICFKRLQECLSKWDLDKSWPSTRLVWMFYWRIMNL